MLQAKATKQIQKILRILLDNEVVTTQELSSYVGLSEKTVRVRLNNINDYIVENNYGKIVRKTRVGVWLDIVPGQEPNIRALLSGESRNEITKADNNPMHVVGYFLQRPESCITLNQISSDLYLSIPTISKMIDEAAEWFEKYDIKLERQPNKGHWLVFEEIQYRFAYRTYLLATINRVDLQESLTKEFEGVNVDFIYKTIVDSENIWDIRLIDDTFVNILILLTLTVFRNSQNKHVDYKIDKEIFEKREYDFIDSIARKVFEYERLDYHEKEIMVVATELLFNSGLNEVFDNVQIKEQDKKLENVVERMIDTVGEVLNMDFKEDNILSSGLTLHLRAAIFRLKFGYKQLNSQYKDIRTSYSYVYRAVWSTSIIVEEEFNVQMSAGELAYITLYFQAAIERIESPLTYVLVTSASNARNQLITDNLKRRVLGDVEIEVLSFHSIQDADLSMYDVILSTEPIKEGEYLRRVVQVSSVLSDSDIRHINHHINLRIIAKGISTKHFDTRCHELFDRDLIFKFEEAESKEQLIRTMSKQLEKKKFVTKKYYKSVMDRESHAETSIGNSVAIPHGNQNEILIPNVAVAVLSQPMKWTEDEEVQLIFLLAVRMKDARESQITKLFYRQYIGLVSDRENINLIVNMKDENEIYNYLVS